MVFSRERGSKEALKIIADIKDKVADIMQSQGLSPREVEKGIGKKLDAAVFEKFERNLQQQPGETAQEHLNRLRSLQDFLSGIDPRVSDSPFHPDRKTKVKSLSRDEQETLRRQIAAIYLHGTDAIDPDGNIIVDLTTMELPADVERLENRYTATESSEPASVAAPAKPTFTKKLLGVRSRELYARIERMPPPRDSRLDGILKNLRVLYAKRDGETEQARAQRLNPIEKTIHGFLYRGKYLFRKNIVGGNIWTGGVEKRDLSDAHLLSIVDKIVPGTNGKTFEQFLTEEANKMRPAVVSAGSTTTSATSASASTVAATAAAPVVAAPTAPVVAPAAPVASPPPPTPPVKTPAEIADGMLRVQLQKFGIEHGDYADELNEAAYKPGDGHDARLSLIQAATGQIARLDKIDPAAKTTAHNILMKAMFDASQTIPGFDYNQTPKLKTYAEAQGWLAKSKPASVVIEEDLAQFYATNTDPKAVRSQAKTKYEQLQMKNKIGAPDVDPKAALLFAQVETTCGKILADVTRTHLDINEYAFKLVVLQAYAQYMNDTAFEGKPDPDKLAQAQAAFTVTLREQVNKSFVVKSGKDATEATKEFNTHLTTFVNIMAQNMVTLSQQAHGKR
jgi:hypothetical protein